MIIIDLIVSAALLGIIIAAMEEEEFPGWGAMTICVLAAVIPQAVIVIALGQELALVGLVAGAVCAAVAISATCGMTLQRSLIAVGIFFGIRIALAFALTWMMS